MSAHDEAWKAREGARRAMIEATAELASARARIDMAKRGAALAGEALEAKRARFLEADRKFQQLLAADSAGVLGNVAQVEHAGEDKKV